MYGRTGLDRFKKAQSLEPFSVSVNSASKTAKQPATKAVTHPAGLHSQSQTSNQHSQHHVTQKPIGPDSVVPTSKVTQIGGGQSAWQPPDWAIEPLPGLYYLEVMKDGEVLDQINLDKRRHLFGRQFHACDIVLDHQSVSRQHAAVIPHKNGSIYVIDLGSAHGTFVANERLTKDTPVELEAGQSLRFAASTRSYILRKNTAALLPSPPVPTEINLPPPPDPSDEEAVVAYNTTLNRYGLTKSNSLSKPRELSTERPAKRRKKTRVSFRDQVGGLLVEVVGVSDGADVETEPGPLGLKEGSLVGKYESLVQSTVIPKGKEQASSKDENGSNKGVTDKLQEVLNKVKSGGPKGGIYGDLYGESVSVKVGSSWAFPSVNRQAFPSREDEGKGSGKSGVESSRVDDESDDDLFGD